MHRTLFLAALSATACYVGRGPESDEAGDSAPGAQDDGTADGGAESGGDDDDDDAVPAQATRSGLRRLTIAEYDNALRDLVGDDTRPGGEFVPADAMAPFDNDYAGQSPSEALIVGAEKLATEAAQRLLDDPKRLAGLTPCAPTDAGDAECLVEFVTGFGRRAFRRPLVLEEIEAYTSLIAVGIDGNDWNLAAAAVIRSMLQDPNFLYRVEIGEAVEGSSDIVKLSDWEMATRLSFLLWGTIPDDALLDAADDDALSSADQIRETAELMLADPRALDTVNRFHAMWLGYSTLAGSELAEDMAQESRALVERVAFDPDASWLSLLSSPETFVTPALAQHYGLATPESPGGAWVTYGDDGRGGILSHGSVLGLGAKFNDTSPTVRGVELRSRLFCESVEIPPDLEVNVDDPPGGVDLDACKWDRYAAHREVGACAGCHALTDGLGFGLENYDATGAFRTHDVGKPECVIAGDGEVVGFGEFNGPGELGAMLEGVPAVRNCAVRQLYSYASGRKTMDALDGDFLIGLHGDLGEDSLNLVDLMVRVATSDAFRFRVIEGGQ